MANDTGHTTRNDGVNDLDNLQEDKDDWTKETEVSNQDLKTSPKGEDMAMGFEVVKGD